MYIYKYSMYAKPLLSIEAVMLLSSTRNGSVPTDFRANEMEMLRIATHLATLNISMSESIIACKVQAQDLDLNRCCAETGIFLANKVNTMIANTLGPCVTRTSAIVVLNMNKKWILVLLLIDILSGAKRCPCKYMKKRNIDKYICMTPSMTCALGVFSNG